jgi:hypothetical protein
MLQGSNGSGLTVCFARLLPVGLLQICSVATSFSAEATAQVCEKLIGSLDECSESQNDGAHWTHQRNERCVVGVMRSLFSGHPRNGVTRQLGVPDIVQNA